MKFSILAKTAQILLLMVIGLPLLKAQYTTDQREKMIKAAESKLGVRYGWGCPERNCKDRIDCSALVQRSAWKAGINKLPRNSLQQANHKEGLVISRVSSLRRGDLVFFNMKANDRRPVDHVGIVVSNKKGKVRFIHSSVNNNGVAYNMLEGKWVKGFKKGRRIFNTGQKGESDTFDPELIAGKYRIASMKYLNASDIKGLSPCEIKVMKNEIFARYGYVFHTNRRMINYFNQQEWYKNTPKISRNGQKIIERYFNKYELRNVNFLKRREGTCSGQL